VEIPALGHSWDSGKVTTAATTAAEGVKTYTCTVCGVTRTEAIPKLAEKAQKVKAAQPMTVKAKTVTVSYNKLQKKSRTLAVKKTLTIKKAKGTKKFVITKVNKRKAFFKINAKTGKITVRKGLKKGTYKVTVKVIAAGNDNYLAGSKTKTVKIKVR
jgi:hypothetical protein